MIVRRTTGLLLQVFMMLPAELLGADVSGSEMGGFSFLGSLLQMVAALALVIGMILLVYVMATRLSRRIPVFGATKRYIRVIEVHAVAPRKALMLVEVGGEYLLLANSGEQLSFVKHIDMLEEAEPVVEPAEQQPFLAILKRIKKNETV